jgi:hypothetical protein
MTTEDLFDVLADAMTRNDTATTEAVLAILEMRLPADELADRLDALLQATSEELPSPTLCA